MPGDSIVKIASFGRRQDFLAATRARPVRGVRPEDGPWEGVSVRGSERRRWFYKRVRRTLEVTARPNVVGEVLTPRIFARLGLPHLPVEPLRIEADQSWIVGMPWIELEGARATHRRSSDLPLPRLAALRDGGLSKLYLADLLVGNGDRHPGNLLVSRSGCLPIDHGLALLRPALVLPRCDYFHFLPSFAGVGGCAGEAPSARRARRALGRHRRRDAWSGTPEAIARPHPLYIAALDGLREDDASRRSAKAFIAGAREALSPRGVERLTEDLPEELFEADGDVGREYLQDTLATRLARLDRALDLAC